MTDAIDPATLDQYSGQKVLLTAPNKKFDAQQGTVVSGSDIGVLFKTRGSTKQTLVLANEITAIELDPDVEQVSLKPRRVDPVSLKLVKRHLIDRHGFRVSEVEPLSPESAFDLHENQLDHSDLGHFHAEAPPKEEKDKEEVAVPGAPS